MVSVLLPFTILAVMLSSARAGADMSSLASWMPRSLQQVAPQCTCLRSDFTCSSSLLYCPAGTLITTPLAQAFNCIQRAGIAAINPACSSATTLSTEGTIQCPGHSGFGPVRVCLSGVSVNGGDTSSCITCKNVTLMGSCDVAALTPTVTSVAFVPQWGRTRLTGCNQRVACTSPDQIIDVASLGCSKTNNVDPTGGDLFWYDATVQDAFYYDMKSSGTLPTKIKCGNYLLSNACTYTVSAAPSNGCLNKINPVTVTVGNLSAAAPISSSFNPEECPAPSANP